MIIQVDADGFGEVHVSVVEQNGESELVDTFATKIEAEAKAKALARQLGCDWETNY